MGYSAEQLIMNESITEKDISFTSEGATIRGKLFLPMGAKSSACVVMSHGFSATYPMTLSAYAESIRDAGFSTLFYDHRNFGISDGEPRGEINPWVQSRGILDAINFAKSVPELKNNKIALWGDSYSALHAIVVASISPDVSAVIAQVPACGMVSPNIQPTMNQFHQLREILIYGDVTSEIDVQVGPMPVVSPCRESISSILPPLTAYRWFIEYGCRFKSNWENEATWLLPKTSVPYSGHIVAPYLDVPTLMMIAPEDEMPGALPSVAYEVYQLIKNSKKKLFDVKGGHFGLLWHPSTIFNKVVSAQIEYLNDVLA